MHSKFFESRSKASYLVFLLFLLCFIITSPIVNSETMEEKLQRIQMIIPPKGNVEYNITADESSYMVFRIKLNTTEDLSKSVSINLLRNSEEYTQCYYIKDANNIYGWARLKPGNYRLIISNSIEKAIPVYGYILLFRYYDPRLPQLVNEKIYGIKNTPAPVGIADYGVYIDEETDQLVCYRYSTKEVIGIAYINKLDGYSVNPYNRDIKPGELSLQLNLIVKARTLSDKIHTLWIQNIYMLKNYSNTLYYRIDDELYNVTFFGGADINPNSIKGRGKVFSYGPAKLYWYYDENWRPIARLFKPILLLLHVKVDNSKIYFAHGYFANKDNQFYEVHDEVILNGYKDLNIVVDGCNFTGKPLDMELVIGGSDTNYRVFVANNMDMKLTLLIKNTTWIPPPATWSIGTRTREKTSNVVSKLEYSIVTRLIKGVPEAEQLWSKDVFSKFSLTQPELCIVRFSNGTSSIRVMPTSSLEGFRIEGIYKVGPLSITLIQEEKLGLFTSFHHYIVFGVVVALVAVAVSAIRHRSVENAKTV